MTTIYVIYGLPGAGKTYARTQGPLRYLMGTPVVDMDDLYRSGVTDWAERLHKLQDAIIEAVGNSDDLVVEGIFEPGSPSERQLRSFLRHIENDYQNVDVDWWGIQADYVTCLKRLLADYEQDANRARLVGRVFLLSKYAGGYR
jgi:hypothetical protein